MLLVVIVTIVDGNYECIDVRRETTFLTIGVDFILNFILMNIPHVGVVAISGKEVLSVPLVCRDYKLVKINLVPLEPAANRTEFRIFLIPVKREVPLGYTWRLKSKLQEKNIESLEQSYPWNHPNISSVLNKQFTVTFYCKDNGRRPQCIIPVYFSLDHCCALVETKDRKDHLQI
ncbi:hypothetical protein FF38_03778 [Lucilia cuprina]|uniref:Uncharacterized protein n=1 Tax=Lucilia cuprina TaxID=7375 RepID=A0A0L0CF52_LUCCU|nr:hypothetical protein FF38_03778 [Lucilia cuprina]